MSISWTALPLTNATGALYASMDDLGIVRVRGTVTTTVNGPAYAVAGVGASADLSVLGGVFNPVSGFSPGYIDWEAAPALGIVVQVGLLQFGYFSPSGSVLTFDDKVVWQAAPAAVSPGGLITRDGQYEFKGLVFNGSAQDDVLKVISCQGLFDLPDAKGQMSELSDDHGGQVGRQLFSMRRIVMELVLVAPSKAAMQINSRTITGVLQPDDVDSPLVFQRAGIGKQQINARVRRFTGFKSDWEREFGQSPATVEFVCPDPRKLAYAQSSQVMTAPASNPNASGTVGMLGNFRGGAKPIIEVAGPWLNPRIANAGDGGRTLRVDVNVPAGQLLVFDSRDRTIKLNGVELTSEVRTDNEWWVLAPGNNLITATRTTPPATASNVTVKWWESWA